MLKTEDALITGLATAAVVIAVYQHNLPAVAQVRASAPNNKHVESSRKQAAIISLGVVSGIALIARDPTVFVIGGSVLIGADLAHRLANATDQKSGKILTPDTTGDATAAPTGS